MDLHYVYIFFQLIAFLFAISIHESAHAWMASRCGDPTARMLGRITLNPLRHIDPVGTILLPAMALLMHFPVFGWAKPTPVDPRNFKNPVRDDILTSVAGPASNFLVVIVAVVLLGLLALTSPSAHYVVQTLARSSGNLALDAGWITPLALMLYQLMVINILLGIFNLIPIPPLDGSHVLRHFLSGGVLNLYDRVGMFGLMLLLFFGGRYLWALISPVVNFFNDILARI
ncbi:MAG: site-2 protease family protein [Candidatus Korobacteraceae bacterium]|jgi:Zn-dependent protease